MQRMIYLVMGLLQVAAMAEPLHDPLTDFHKRERVSVDVDDKGQLNAPPKKESRVAKLPDLEVETIFEDPYAEPEQPNMYTRNHKTHSRPFVDPSDLVHQAAADLYEWFFGKTPEEAAEEAQAESLFARKHGGSPSWWPWKDTEKDKVDEAKANDDDEDEDEDDGMPVGPQGPPPTDLPEHEPAPLDMKE